MITGMQIRAGRAVLKWSAQDLASRVGTSLKTIQRLELAEGVPATRATTLESIQRAFEAAGLEFIWENGGGPGVRLRKRRQP
jgi:transcriptional regulator with XRE-family HTH domain